MVDQQCARVLATVATSNPDTGSCRKGRSPFTAVAVATTAHEITAGVKVAVLHVKAPVAIAPFLYHKVLSVDDTGHSIVMTSCTVLYGDTDLIGTQEIDSAIRVPSTKN